MTTMDTKPSVQRLKPTNKHHLCLCSRFMKVDRHAGKNTMKNLLCLIHARVFPDQNTNLAVVVKMAQIPVIFVPMVHRLARIGSAGNNGWRTQICLKKNAEMVKPFRSRFPDYTVLVSLGEAWKVFAHLHWSDNPTPPPRLQDLLVSSIFVLGNLLVYDSHFNPLNFAKSWSPNRYFNIITISIQAAKRQP